MLREPFLEFWGAFIMVLMGNSVLAQTYLSEKEYGTWLNICLGCVSIALIVFVLISKC